VSCIVSGVSTKILFVRNLQKAKATESNSIVLIDKDNKLAYLYSSYKSAGKAVGKLYGTNTNPATTLAKAQATGSAYKGR
jgi:hypothetical protein